MPQKNSDANEKRLPERQNKDAKKVIVEVAKKAARPESKIVPMEQLVVFELDKEEYASVITDLREIIRIPEITPIPGAPVFIRGLLNLRGQIVMVIDLEKRFHLVREHPKEPKHIIIVEVEDSIFGITVDEVTGVLRVPEASIKPTPELVSSKIHAEYLRGVVVLEAEDVPQEKKKQKTKDAAEKVKKIGTTKRGQSEQDEPMVPEQTTQSQGARLIILVDIPKMLTEKELLEFGSAVQETVGTVPNKETSQPLSPKS
jgi:purine-binding chemotaxis protein CheW